VDRIARVIVEHSRPILGVTALISLTAALMLFRMDFNADIAAVVLEGNEEGETFKALQDKYATTDPINVVATATSGTFNDPETAAALVELRDLLAATDGVAQVASLVPEANPLTGQPITPEVVRALPAGAVEALLAQNPLADLLLDEGATNTLVLVTPADDGLSVARNLDGLSAPEGVELTLSGNPIVFAAVLDVLSFVLLFIPPLVVVLLIGTFYATIGDRRLSALAIFPAVLGSLWTFGLIFGLGRQVDIVTVIVPIFVIVMGSADGLHFVTHFQEEAEGNPDPVARVSSALSHVGVPMILTTISTAAGFLSLLATDVQPIRQLGLFAAIGISFAGFISFFSLPALISRLTIEPHHHTAVLGPRVTAGLRGLVRTRRPALVLGVGLLLFSAIFVPRLEVDSDQLFFFKDDDPVRLAFQKTEELFGGATPLVGEFAYDPATGVAGLSDAQDAAEVLESQPGVRDVFSVGDLATDFPELTRGVLTEQVTLPLGDLVSDDGLRFVLFPGEFDSNDLQGWLDLVDQDERINVLTGMPVVWDEIARLVLRAQLVSLAVAFALVAVMLFAAYRRVRETLVSLVPIALTVLVLLGFIAASGIQLNLLTAVISSIVIGVGIDYAIHYVAAIDHARKEGDGYVLRAIDRAGRPIVANALGIAIALTALWLSPLRIHAQVSMIMWVAMTVAASSALLLIPALLPRQGVRTDR
jgi:predicted RND superfamily exporter protein